MTCQFICMGAACAGECRPAAKRCSALVPQECDQNGRWQSMAACPNLCMNGACTGDCTPGQKRCSGNTVQTCSAAGRYVASETCPFVCQGSGVCGGQCVPGRRQCSGTTPQVCSNDGQWMNTTGNECLKDRGATCGGGQRMRVTHVRPGPLLQLRREILRRSVPRRRLLLQWGRLHDHERLRLVYGRVVPAHELQHGLQASR